MFSCGCDPIHGTICPDHCQRQGCTDAVHTGACKCGRRVVVCQYNAEPHMLSDECVNVTDAGNFEAPA